MNKFKLSVLATACVLPLTASAQYQVYDDGVNSVGLSGWIDVGAVHSQGKTELVDHATRFRISLDRQISPELKALAVTEVGVNLVGNTEIKFGNGDTVHTENGETFNFRLGYVGLAHDSLGTITLGKQWGVYSDVAAPTEVAHAWAGTASGQYTFNGDGGLNGTGRADKAIQYRNTFGNFSIGLQTQARHSSDIFSGEDESAKLDSPMNRIAEISYDQTFGVSAMYNFTDDMFVGIAHNEGKFEGTYKDATTVAATDKITGVVFSMGTLYKQGFNFVAHANQSENHDVDNVGRIIPKSVGFELLTSYTFSNKLTPMFTVNYLKADESYEAQYNDGEFNRAFAVVGAHYSLDSQTILYAEARKDFSKMNDAQMQFEDDGVAAGIRMYF